MNFSLSINSKFRPFTYDEMVKPLVQYKEAYDKVEQDYSTLAAQTEMWKNIAERENNPIAYEMYNRYSNDLAAITEDFSRGMNLNNRRALLKMKQRYASDIQPIADASKKREELAAEQRKLSASNPDLMYDRDFSNISIDELMENPNLSYTVTDGKDLYNKGKAITTAMASRLNKVSLSPELKNQYFKIVEGFGEDVANQFLLDSNAIPELNKALEDLVNSTNVTDANKRRAFEYARQGAISGMVSKTSYQNNKAFVTPSEAVNIESTRLNMSLAKQAAGMEPYMIDDEGTQYFYNKNTGEKWSVDADRNISMTGSDDGTEEIKNRLIDDKNYPGYKYDKKTGKHYEVLENGDIIYRTVSEIKAAAEANTDKGVTRRNNWRTKNNYNALDPIPISISTVSGSVPKVIDAKNIKEEYEKINTNKSTTTMPYELLAGDDYKEIKSWVDRTLQVTNLKKEDIIIRRYKPFGRDERWVIDIKPDSASSTSDMNPSQRPA